LSSRRKNYFRVRDPGKTTSEFWGLETEQRKMTEKPCTLLINYDKREPPNAHELKQLLEKGSKEEKVEALKNVILLLLNGELLPQLLMTIIRFVMPLDDHEIKKLILVYLETVEKTNADGKLLPEMILVW
jgi:coatomer subunit beta